MAYKIYCDSLIFGKEVYDAKTLEGARLIKADLKKTGCRNIVIVNRITGYKV